MRRGFTGGSERVGRVLVDWEADERKEADPMELFEALLKKIRRGLGVKHLTGTGGSLRIAPQSTVRGRIAWDEETKGETPLMVIDGREIGWEQFGRMVMMYEGWQFKMDLRDMSEEL